MDYAMSVAQKFALPVKKKVKALSTGYASNLPPDAGPLLERRRTSSRTSLVLGLDAQHRDLFYRLLMEKMRRG